MTARHFDKKLSVFSSGSGFTIRCWGTKALCAALHLEQRCWSSGSWIICPLTPDWNGTIPVKGKIMGAIWMVVTYQISTGKMTQKKYNHNFKNCDKWRRESTVTPSCCFRRLYPPTEKQREKYVSQSPQSEFFLLYCCKTTQHFHYIYYWWIALLQSVHITQLCASGFGPVSRRDCQIQTELIPGKLSKEPSTGTRLMKPTATGKKPLSTAKEERKRKQGVNSLIHSHKHGKTAFGSPK